MNTTIKTEIEPSNIDSSIIEYVQTRKPKLYILTPCYGGVCFTNYVAALIQTCDLFKKYNFPLQIEFCKNDSLVSRARNNLIAKALADPQMTHVLFIDGDITWNPIDILKLVLSDKQLIGGIYPLKHYFWEKGIDNAKQEQTGIQQIIDRKYNNNYLKQSFSNTDILQFNLLKYNINYLTSELSINENKAEVKHLATGFMMIRRDTLEIMMAALPETKYTDDIGFLSGRENDFAYALFDCGVEEGHYYSEDWMFCHRWKKLGGSIWVDVSINLTHTGNEDFRGCYIASVL